MICNSRFLLYFILVVNMLSCKKPYSPPAVSNPGSYLVVEGVINSGSDSTIIKLSRTVKISSDSIKIESNAQVAVESSKNDIYALKETTPGTYGAAGLKLDNTLQYRLSIKTANSEAYLSDLVAVKPTPPIDSVGFTVQNDGIQIYASAHDPANNTHYYRWDYSETWQFHAKYYSAYKVLYTPYVPSDTIVSRPFTEQIYYCFANDSSSTVLLGSTAALKQDVIYQAPITTVQSTSEKLEAKYSILLRQYALTADAYNFWKNLKKNTEQLGSIFDAQPSQISGNIHCISNPALPVIGYISVTNVQTKRVFITSAQLPQSFLPTYPYDCEEDSTYFVHPVTNNPDVLYDFYDTPPGSILPISQSHDSKGILFYFRADAECADCTIRGKTKQPVFWK